MANHPSAEKRDRQRIKRQARNRGVRTAVRTQVKDLRALIAAGNKKAAGPALRSVESALRHATSAGVIHRNTTDRTVARLARAVHRLGT